MDKDPGKKIVIPGEDDGPDDRWEILDRAMRANQPQFIDFKGQPGFSDRMIEECKIELAEKIRRDNEKNRNNPRAQDAAANDPYSKYSEPLIAYIFNDERMLRTRKTFSFLASEYDDKINGTDIIVGVENKKAPDSNPIICAIDASTGTNYKNVMNKFTENSKWHRSTPPWCSYAKFCRLSSYCWSDPEALHFTLGIMPSSMDKALDKIEFKDGVIMGRDADSDTDFMLLSEMREQIVLQKFIISRATHNDYASGQLERLNSLLPAVNTRLRQICGVNKVDESERDAYFKREYEKRKQKSRYDTVYKNITDACRSYKAVTIAIKE